MANFWTLVFLVACSETALAPKGSGPTPGDTAVDTACPPQVPDCAPDDSAAPDTGDTSGDSAAPNLDECALTLSAAGTVRVREDCTLGRGTPAPDPWDVEVAFQRPATGWGPMGRPAVAELTDDNGDGVVDLLDTPDIVYADAGTQVLVAEHGDGSGRIFERGGWLGTTGVATVDLDGDGSIEICGFTTFAEVQCADAAGNILWRKRSPSGDIFEFAELTACDLDADGRAELIADALVLDGPTGAVVFEVPNTTSVFTVPICTDLDLDGTMEIVIDDSVVEHDGTVAWSLGPPVVLRGTAVANTDGDPEGEVFVADTSVRLYEADGTLIWEVPFLPGHDPGPPCVADFDADGRPEFVLTAGDTLIQYDADGRERWRVPLYDEVGSPGCVAWDADGDGVQEVVVADEEALRFHDGATGALLYENHDHTNNTFLEYPLVVDLDADGSAEIVLAQNLGRFTGVTVFRHAAGDWPGAGPIWPTHDFNVTNIDGDGSVPVSPIPGWSLYGVFRGLPTIRPPAADLAGRIGDLCVADCIDGPVAVALEVWNEGGRDVAAGTPWALYRIDGGVRMLVTTGVLPAVPSGTRLASLELRLSLEDVGSEGFVVVLDDDGAGNGRAAECDDANNTLLWATPVCG